MTTTLKTLMRLKLQRTAAAAAAAVAARAPSPQANECRLAKEKTATYREQGKINKNTCCSSLQHGVVALPGRCIIMAFVSCTNMWCFQPGRRRSLPRVLCLIPGISYTPPISGKFKYYIDSSRLFLLNALNNTAEG